MQNWGSRPQWPEINPFRLARNPSHLRRNRLKSVQPGGFSSGSSPIATSTNYGIASAYILSLEVLRCPHLLFSTMEKIRQATPGDSVLRYVRTVGARAKLILVGLSI